MGIIQSSVAEHASRSQWPLITRLGIIATFLWSEDLICKEGNFSCPVKESEECIGTWRQIIGLTINVGHDQGGQSCMSSLCLCGSTNIDGSRNHNNV